MTLCYLKFKNIPNTIKRYLLAHDVTTKQTRISDAVVTGTWRLRFLINHENLEARSDQDLATPIPLQSLSYFKYISLSTEIITTNQYVAAVFICKSDFIWKSLFHLAFHHQCILLHQNIREVHFTRGTTQVQTSHKRKSSSPLWVTRRLKPWQRTQPAAWPWQQWPKSRFNSRFHILSRYPWETLASPVMLNLPHETFPIFWTPPEGALMSSVILIVGEGTLYYVLFGSSTYIFEEVDEII